MFSNGLLVSYDEIVGHLMIALNTYSTIYMFFVKHVLQKSVCAENDWHSGWWCLATTAAKWTFSGSGLDEGQPQPKDTGRRTLD